MENVLLITIDSLRPDHLSYRGYHRDTSPHLDKYADSGSTFLNTFAHVGGTNPSFPSILSSVHPLMYGGFDTISDEQTLVSEVFQDAGYQTGGFHSNLYLSADFGYDRGHETFFDSKPDPSFTQRARQYIKKNLSGTPIFDVLKRGYDFAESAGGVNVGSYHVPGNELTDMALRYIEECDSSRPVFLWVHYMDVHHPFLPPEKYQKQFLAEPLSDREAIKLRRRAIEEPETFTESDTDNLIGLYDAEIRFTDEEVNRLIQSFKRQMGDALVAITADHGEHFVERGSLSGHRPYEEKLRVPLIIDGWDDDGEYEDLVGLMDLSPTLVDQAGLERPSTWCGQSLSERVFEDEWDRTEIFGGYGEAENRVMLCRESRWKLISRGGDESDELYDLDADPGEAQNLTEQHPTVVSRIRDRLKDYEQHIRATNEGLTQTQVEMDEEVKQRLRRLGYQE